MNNSQWQRFVCLLLPLLVAFTPIGLSQQVKLLPADGTAFHNFGETVAISADGSFVIVGADGDEEYGNNAGAAYIFIRDGGKYKEIAKLKSKDIQENDFFGRSVAISADGAWALVGVPGDDDKGGSSGSVYVFVRKNGTWEQQNKLIASDGSGSDSFGEAVSISGAGDVALIGAPRDDDMGNDSGSAYVFTRSGNTWRQETKLTALDGRESHLFGNELELSMDGTHALFGVINDEEHGELSGSAYVFARRGSTWVEEDKLVPTDGAIQDFFGRSVAINADGRVALIGAEGDDDGGASSGSAYVFTKEGGKWSFSDKLTTQDAAVGDLFGEAVSLDAEGQYALIGASGDDDGGDLAGSAYIFQLKGSSWAEKSKLLANDGGSHDRFGQAVALSPDASFAIVGVYQDDDEGDNAGSAYVFGGTSLPVELARFTATANANSILLQWETASELNNAGFYIEQWMNGEWEQLTFVNGAGTTTEPQFYSHSIHNRPPGHYRFRLKQTDYDGSVAYSPETEVTVGVSGRYDLQLAGPHPVRNHASWVLTLPTAQNVAVNIYDLLGRKTASLYQGWLDSNDPLRLEWGAGSAAPGVYLITVEGARFSESRQFVLMR